MSTKRKNSKYRIMWATTAMHLLGDISRDHGDFCQVAKMPVGGHYIGNWITGFGFIKVEFPVETTKTLTKEQRARFKKLRFGIR